MGCDTHRLEKTWFCCTEKERRRSVYVVAHSSTILVVTCRNLLDRLIKSYNSRISPSLILLKAKLAP